MPPPHFLAPCMPQREKALQREGCGCMGGCLSEMGSLEECGEGAVEGDKFFGAAVWGWCVPVPHSEIGSSEGCRAAVKKQ